MALLLVPDLPWHSDGFAQCWVACARQAGVREALQSGAMKLCMIEKEWASQLGMYGMGGAESQVQCLPYKLLAASSKAVHQPIHSDTEPPHNKPSKNTAQRHPAGAADCCLQLQLMASFPHQLMRAPVTKKTQA